jgi:hypothetical protein
VCGLRDTQYLDKIIETARNPQRESWFDKVSDMATIWRDIGVALISAVAGALATELVKPIFADPSFDLQVKVMHVAAKDGPIPGATVDLGVPNILRKLTFDNGIASFPVPRGVSGIHGILLVTKEGYQSVANDLKIEPHKDYVMVWLEREAATAPALPVKPHSGKGKGLRARDPS